MKAKFLMKVKVRL